MHLRDKIRTVVSLPKTIYFNFKVLEKKDAVKLPFFVDKDVKLGKLYKNVIEIAELCLLYYNIVLQSSLEKELKEAFIQPISIQKESINRLFYLYLLKNINIIKTTASIEDDLFERYKKTNERFIERFKNAELALQNIQ